MSTTTTTAKRYTECTGRELMDIREAFINGDATISFVRGSYFRPTFKRYNVNISVPGSEPVWIGWVTGDENGWTAHKIHWRDSNSPIVEGMPIAAEPFAKRRHAADEIVWSATR